MDGACLEPGGMYGVHHLAELVQLAGGLRVPRPHGVKLGVDALQRHIGQGAVGQQDFFRFTDQKPAKAHPRVHLDVGAGYGGPVFRQGVEGQAGIHRGDGAHHVQVHQLFQLLPVRCGAEHQDLLVLKARVPQLFGLPHLAHSETADALCPEQPSHGDDAGPAAVSGEYPIDGRARSPFLDDGQVVLHRGLLNHQLAHKNSPLCLSGNTWLVCPRPWPRHTDSYYFTTSGEK